VNLTLRGDSNGQSWKRESKGFHDMIIYDLSCDNGHRFEGWFRNPDDYQSQSANGLLDCPVCSSSHVCKVPTASRINRGAAAPVEKTESREMAQATASVAASIREFIEGNFEDVGSRFPDEARRIHYGEAEARNIRGTATRDEARALSDEGVSAIALPAALVDKSKLN
jgi:hypothetical protein